MRPPPDPAAIRRIDEALGDAADKMAKEMLELAESLRTGKASEDERRRARLWWRLYWGIPQREHEGEAQVIALRVGEWVTAARELNQDERPPHRDFVDWLWTQCARIDERFLDVPMETTAMAIASSDSPLLVAAKLIKAASMYAGEAATLAQTARNLRSNSRAEGVWTDDE